MTCDVWSPFKKCVGRVAVDLKAAQENGKMCETQCSGPARPLAGELTLGSYWHRSWRNPRDFASLHGADLKCIVVPSLLLPPKYSEMFNYSGSDGSISQSDCMHTCIVC